MILIRTESPDDHDAIRRVTFEAFSGTQFGHNGEAELIDTLRDKCQRSLSLVAFDNDELVGHVLFTPVVIRNDSDELYGMGLAPLSVLPAHQRRGIGSLLLSAGFERLAASQNLFTVVAGHPDYYQRFGFVPAANFGFSHGFKGMPQEIFFIRTKNPDLLRSARGGKVYYRPEFGPQHST